MPIYTSVFEQIKADYPTKYSHIIQVYLDLITEFYEDHPSLATVEILDNFQKYRNASSTKSEFADVYEKYGDTDFLTSRLNESDIKYLKMRYIQGLAKLGKEYDCVI